MANSNYDSFHLCFLMTGRGSQLLPPKVEPTMGFRAGKNPANAYLSTYLCALFALPAHGQTSQSALQRMQAVENHLSRYVVIRDSRNDDMNLISQMKALGVPAVSIATIRNGAIDWARAYGVSSLEGAQVSTETLFGAASISKPVTALGVLKLVERAK